VQTREADATVQRGSDEGQWGENLLRERPLPTGAYAAVRLGHAMEANKELR
jgi:hypothetical protein